MYMILYIYIPCIGILFVYEDKKSCHFVFNYLCPLDEGDKEQIAKSTFAL